MCFPVAIGALALSATQMAVVGVTLATTAASLASQRQQAKAQERATNEQNAIQADEIAKSAGVELGERARAARRERASMRASASESGINLGSNSFLAALQTSQMNQSNDMGLITQNERGQQRARQANARSLMSRIQMPTAASSAFALGAAGAGAYFNVGGQIKTGSQAALGTH